MTSNFEDHCWQDVVSPGALKIYSHYERQTYVGKNPALLAIDLYKLAYQGGPKPVEELVDIPTERLPHADRCDEYALGVRTRVKVVEPGANAFVVSATVDFLFVGGPQGHLGRSEQRVGLDRPRESGHPSFRSGMEPHRSVPAGTSIGRCELAPLALVGE